MTSLLDASLRHDMDLIRSKVREMGQECERALANALRALVGPDRLAAYLVLLRDRYVDELEQQLDRLCLEFLVRQQPAAGHLRFAYAAIKISSELERIGDHAEAIARSALALEASRPEVDYGPFNEMGQATLGMLRDSVQAFVQHDAELARSTILVERTVDRMRKAIDADLDARCRGGSLALEPFLVLSRISRRTERISDELRDMCAETLYMCTGDYVKHAAPEAYRVLFVDQHNHCRSQMAEAIAASLNLANVIFSSAGLDPRPVDPRLPAFLASKGLELAGRRQQSIDQVPNLQHYHVVVAFDEGAYYALRFRRTPTVCIEWNIPDPSAVQGSPEEVHAAYEEAFSFIDRQLRSLVDAMTRQE